MGTTDDVIDLIRLADRPGTSGHSVSVRVLGRSQPGILFGHDLLDCEIVIVAESLSATFPVTLLPEDLEDWEDTLWRPWRPGNSPCGSTRGGPRRWSSSPTATTDCRCRPTTAPPQESR